MTANGYITIVIVAALGLIGYLFQVAPDSAPTQLPLILAGVGALVAVLNKQGDTDARVEANTAVTVEAKRAAVESKAVAQEAKRAAVESTAVSKENAATLASTAEQQAAALEEQSQTLKEVGEKATKAADGVHVVQGIVDGWRTAMEQQNASLRASVEDLKLTLAHERAVTPPASDSPPAGSTPPHGTPIVPIDPPEAARPKGTRPKVGDQN